MKKAKAHHDKKNSIDTGSSVKALIINSLFGTLVGLLSLVLCIILMSTVCLLPDNPHIFIIPLCFFSMYSSAFFGGFAAVKRNRGGALLCGALCGAALLIAVWLISACIGLGFGISSSGTGAMIYRLIILPVSCVGSLFGNSSSGKKARKPKRRF